MRNYTGQNIFIGIDVHKKTYSVTAICDKQVIKRDKMPACPNKLIDYCFKFFPGASIYSAYEAGFSGFQLHRELLAKGIHNIVVNASSIEIASRDRVKNDKRDSLKIATQLSDGRLNCVFIPSIEREALRGISRLRETLIRDRTRIGVQIKSFLYLNGQINYMDSTKVSRKWVTNLLDRLNDDTEAFYYLTVMVERWLETNNHISEVNKRLKLQAESETHLEKIYRSAPGIASIASRVLINELGDMSQFKNEKALFCYTGLTPQEYSSGEHTRQGHISRQGKPILRKILVQAAWVAVKKDPQLKEIFERLSKKAGKKRAIIGVARRLIGRIRACLRENVEYGYDRVISESVKNEVRENNKLNERN